MQLPVKLFLIRKELQGDEIFWDGTLNGTPVDNGNYAVMITTNSCFPGDFECHDCGSDEDYQYCTGVDSDAAQQGTPNGSQSDNPDIFSFPGLRGQWLMKW